MACSTTKAAQAAATLRLAHLAMVVPRTSPAALTHLPSPHLHTRAAEALAASVLLSHLLLLHMGASTLNPKPLYSSTHSSKAVIAARFDIMPTCHSQTSLQLSLDPNLPQCACNTQQDSRPRATCKQQHALLRSLGYEAGLPDGWKAFSNMKGLQTTGQCRHQHQVVCMHKCNSGRDWSRHFLPCHSIT